MVMSKLIEEIRGNKQNLWKAWHVFMGWPTMSMKQMPVHVPLRQTLSRNVAASQSKA